MRRVLVSERDSLLRELIREWLAEGGVEALCAEAPTPGRADIDAILVDVACQQQAHGVLTSWRTSYPRAAIVVASARFSPADTANDAMANRLGVMRVLAKPFTRDDLWAALGLPDPPASQLARR
ncbi:MAG TPA: response regulator [Steroidobacteraceae bacterium]|nr:response regulator [Candidatus Dormibacteraeota bacterium]HYM29627.1 response regulator [Steroidobacteraceae bacterium]